MKPIPKNNWQERFDEKFECHCGLPEPKHFAFDDDGKEIKTFISQELSSAYTQGYKAGSGGIASDVVQLKEQYDMGYAQGKKDREREMRERVREYKTYIHALKTCEKALSVLKEEK